MKLHARIAACVIGLSVAQALHADSPILANPSLQAGTTTPLGWIAGGNGTTVWAPSGPNGRRSLEAGPTAPGDTVYWRPDGRAVEPGRVYRLSFWARADRVAVGTVVGGLSTANRDFSLSSGWRQYSFTFRSPDSSAGYLRIGEWNNPGQAFFSDISLTPLTPTAQRMGGLQLGDGETLNGDRYTFTAPLGTSNYSRPLRSTSAAYNTGRWILQGDSQIVYDQSVGDRRQVDAQISATVSYHASGQLVVTASTDGANWIPVGSLDHVGTLRANLPASLFPATSLFIRLQTSGAAGSPGQDPSSGSLQVNGYSYQADLAPLSGKGSLAAGLVGGRTLFVENLTSSPNLPVAIADVGSLTPAPGAVLKLTVTNPGTTTVDGAASLDLSADTGPQGTFTAPFRAQPGKTDVMVPYRLQRAGKYRLIASVRVGSTLVYTSAMDFNVASLDAADYGYRLDSEGPDDFWWAQAPHKVSRTRIAPAAVRNVIALNAARNEYADFQVVARPEHAVHGLKIACTSLVSSKGDRIAADQATVKEVAYVGIANPDDNTGAVGEWPDPLPPVTGPVDLKGDENQPFWLTVYVPEKTPPGDYAGTLTLDAPGWHRVAPIRLHVYDFTLPHEAHVQTEFNLSPGMIRDYQHLKSESQLADVMKLYYEDFAAHRISPYSPTFDAPIRVDWGLSGGATTSQPPATVIADQVKVDFSQFDAAMEAALARYHFTTFRLPLEGMGHGTFVNRDPGHVGPYQFGTAEYDTLMGSYLGQLQSHMEAMGWLDKAVVAWFDEPQPKDFSFVHNGMVFLHKYAPKLNRMATVQPAPELYGDVDTWCPLTPRFDADVARDRQKAGDRIWWYICTNPKAPYVTEFIDHPAIEPRMWLWQTWKYGVQGLLIWNTNYWTSGSAYPDSRQDPWADPMSWEVGYNAPIGAHIPWGNGDGRFLYPPVGDPASRSDPMLQGPVDSLRWEMLRDGMQDYEYFWMLREKVNAARARGANTPDVANAEALLQVPSEITSDMTTFTTDPEALLAQRDRIARAIESLP